MAYAYKKGAAWYVGFRDESGKHVRQATKARTKTEALKIAGELERRSERVRLGLEVRPVEMTFGSLMQRWLTTHSAKLRSHSEDESRWRVHLEPTLSGMPLARITTLALEELFASKLADGLSVQTVHHLRGLVRRAFNAAKRWKLWVGENPADAVVLPQVVQRPPQFAKAAEVGPLLGAAVEPYRTFFAIAIYTGLREGEVLGLRKAGVDLETFTIMVERTAESETTKSKKWRIAPIVEELRPYVVARMKAVKGDLLFPELADLSGGSLRVKMLRELRKTLIQAGLLLRIEGKCRRCGHVEPVPDYEPKPCPDCGMALWPIPIPIPLTVHQLRHTFVSHLLMSGADAHAVQRLAGHADLKTTLDRYGHLSPKYLRGEAELLRFSPSSHSAPGEKTDEAAKPVQSLQSPRRLEAQDAGLSSQDPKSVAPSTVQHPESFAGLTGVVDSPPQATTGTREHPSSHRLLTPAQVADLLHVSRDTVYGLIKAGRLKAVRVGGSIRVRASEVEEFIK